MKQGLFLLGSLILFSFSWNFQEGSRQPGIRFDTVFHDFGDMREGAVMDFSFKFRNTGATPLIIIAVEQPCGCTMPSWSKEPVMPGQYGEVKVTFNSKNRSGVFRKTMQVTTNIGNGKDPILLIKGNVIKPSEWKKLKNK